MIGEEPGLDETGGGKLLFPLPPAIEHITRRQAERRTEDEYILFAPIYWETEDERVEVLCKGVNIENLQRGSSTCRPRDGGARARYFYSAAQAYVNDVVIPDAVLVRMVFELYENHEDTATVMLQLIGTIIGYANGNEARRECFRHCMQELFDVQRRSPNLSAANVISVMRGIVSPLYVVQAIFSPVIQHLEYLSNNTEAIVEQRACIGFVILMYDQFIRGNAEVRPSQIDGAGLGLISVGNGTTGTGTIATGSIVALALALRTRMELALTDVVCDYEAESPEGGEQGERRVGGLGIFGAAYFANASRVERKNAQLVFLRRVWITHEDYLCYVRHQEVLSMRGVRRSRRASSTHNEVYNYVCMAMLVTTKTIHCGTEIVWPYQFPSNTYPDRVSLRTLEEIKSGEAEVIIDLTTDSTSAADNDERRGNEGEWQVK